jgi:hypothetical protein
MVPIDITTTSDSRLSAWHVRRALRWLSPNDLAGLGFIRLMDEEPDDPEAQKEPAYLRGFLYNGRYLRKGKDHPAHIALYTSDLYLGMPRFLKLTPTQTLRFAFTLAHELGHHLIATRGYIYKPNEKYKPWRSGTFDPHEEKMADTYAEDVVKKMCKSWYYKSGKLLARIISRILFEVGVGEHWNGNYESAARWNFNAFMINPENLDAGQSYRHDMEKFLDGQQPATFLNQRQPEQSHHCGHTH